MLGSKKLNVGLMADLPCLPLLILLQIGKKGKKRAKSWGYTFDHKHIFSALFSYFNQESSFSHCTFVILHLSKNQNLNLNILTLETNITQSEETFFIYITIIHNRGVLQIFSRKPGACKPTSLEYRFVNEDCVTRRVRYSCTVIGRQNRLVTSPTKCVNSQS